jgi:hypothetical protein
LIERLAVDVTLRRLCGWHRAGEVLSESTFSRAFAEFAENGLPSRIHEALIKETHKDRLVNLRDNEYSMSAIADAPTTMARHQSPHNSAHGAFKSM